MVTAAFVALALAPQVVSAGLPPVVWDLAKAYREMGPTREKICLNGLWRIQPLDKLGASRPSSETAEAPPKAGWAYFKVPGPWPGRNEWQLMDCQSLYLPDGMKKMDLSQIRAAWMEREAEVPPNWEGRQILLRLETLNSFATVFIDGKKAGELRFPGGDLDLGSLVKPGKKFRLSLQVLALPLEGVMMSYADSARAKQVKGSVDRRGLCGDAWLLSRPRGPRISDLRIETSVRQGKISVDAGLENLAPGKSYVLKAVVYGPGSEEKTFQGQPFGAESLVGGRGVLATDWKPEKLWDTVSPENQAKLILSLTEGGKVLDQVLPQKFGFREFWIQGRDFYLNGSRIFFSILPMDNAAVGANTASYAGSVEIFKRLKAKGFNAVYGHNYGCEPGTHLSFEEILRAADDTGMLVFFSMPHFGQYKWDEADADKNNGYARDAAYYVREAQNHPSVLMYTMSHNGAGYAEDMNPDMLGGPDIQRDQWSGRNAGYALRCEAIVKAMDPSRIVYHHSAGNLGSMHTVNFYANMTPAQEMNDWFVPWSETGIKPLMLIEYGVPISWDWTLYRGWYKGQREFGSAEAPWQWCQAEWNASFLGDRAFKIQEEEKVNLRWEAGMAQSGKIYHRWDYPKFVGWDGFDDQAEVFAKYITQNLRMFRALGVSGYCVWDHSMHWRLREGADRGRKELPTDWDQLQKPGFSPDFLDQRTDTFEEAYEMADWIPTAAGRAVERNNRPLLAFIAGPASALTSQDHDFQAGMKVEKQLIVINNSRAPVQARCSWTVDLPRPLSGSQDVLVKTGDQVRLPLALDLPRDLPPGDYKIKASFSFGVGISQDDDFTLHVLPAPSAVRAAAAFSLYDPRGRTTALLKDLGLGAKTLAPGAKPDRGSVLILGREALGVEGPGPDLTGVKDGLRVLVFEQSAKALEQRLGFRVAEQGLRQVFRRVPDHPALKGLDEEALRDWRGEATLQPPRLSYVIGEKYTSAVTWAGLEVTRSWRCGNRGNVASVLIEKPSRGDFLPLLDGGFNEQYSPLLEYREGSGIILFCQLDVTDRTQSEPASALLLKNLLEYMAAWKPSPGANLIYASGSPLRDYMGKAGFSEALKGAASSRPEGAAYEIPGGPGASLGLEGPSGPVNLSLDTWVGGGTGGGKVSFHQAEHIASFFERPALASAFAGVGPSDVEDRDCRKMALVSGAGETLGDGVLAREGNVIYDQLLPWDFDYAKNFGLKITYRRSAYAFNRILANLGLRGSTPLLGRFAQAPVAGDKRWLDGFYMDQPEEWDDPYRFFRW